MVPTLWIVLGPLGQSITAANLLGGVARLALPAPYATAFAAFGVVYGVPVWGFAALWAALATALTVRAAPGRLPFSLTWWSFTFPVGTCVTGTIALAGTPGRTRSAGPRWRCTWAWWPPGSWSACARSRVRGGAPCSGRPAGVPAGRTVADEVARMTQDSPRRGRIAAARPSLVAQVGGGGTRASPEGDALRQDRGSRRWPGSGVQRVRALPACWPSAWRGDPGPDGAVPAQAHRLPAGPPDWPGSGRPPAHRGEPHLRRRDRRPVFGGAGDAPLRRCRDLLHHHRRGRRPRTTCPCRNCTASPRTATRSAATRSPTSTWSPPPRPRPGGRPARAGTS